MLSAPLLLKVPEKWTCSHNKILVVGQETLGWSFFKGDDYGYDWRFSNIKGWCDFKIAPDAVPALVEGYGIFNFATNGHPINHRAPFFAAYRKIRAAVGDDAEGFDTSVLWTNIIRMAVDEGSIFKVSDGSVVDDLIDISGQLILCELGVLRPDAIIFFTGPVYDYALQRIFEGVKFGEMPSYKVREFSNIQSAALPEKSWRTYHPAYLQRSKRGSIINYLCGAVESIKLDSNRKANG